MPCPQNYPLIGTTLIVTSTTRPIGFDRYTGQTIYETDTGRTLEWNGVNWRLPWGLPWGRVASVEASASVGLGAGLTTLLTSSSFEVVSNRRYQATAQVMDVSTVANDVTQWFFVDSAGTTQGGGQRVATTTPVAFALRSRELIGASNTTAGTGKTIRLQGKYVSGSGSNSMYADGSFVATLIVEDIGPSTGSPA